MFRSACIRALLISCVAFTVACSGGGDGTTSTQPGPATAVAFSSSAFTFVAIGASQAVTASVNDAQGRAVTTAPLTWSSENSDVADVSGSGRSVTIVAKKSGSTNIRATSGGVAASISITVLGVKSVAISPTSAAIRVGAQQTLVADVASDPGVSRSVNWTSSNSSIATVNAQGIVAALSPGVTNIVAAAVADPGMTSTAQLTVLPARGVILSPGAANIATGATQQLIASVVVEDGQAITVTWASSTPANATVNQQGMVTGVALGSTTITATSTADQTLKGSALISVVPIVRNITVTTPTSPLFLGQTQQLSATVTADAGLATTVNWSSSNTTVATVSASGVVTGVSAGSTSITAAAIADPTKSASVSLSVSSRPVSITLSASSIAIIAGNTSTLIATIDADPGVSKAVTWSSAASSIASVNNGVVTGIANGATIITATSVADPTKKATVSVSVGPRLATSWSATGLNGVMIENIVSTYAIGNNNAYAVNARGDVFHFDGASWVRTARGSTYGTVFTAVHGSGASSVFAVGTGGKIITWNGTTWQAMTSGTSNDLNDVWVESATSAFAVGSNGTAVRLTGTTWASTTTTSTEKLNSVWASGNNVWIAVGTNGELLRFVNNVWLHSNSPTTVTLRDVFGTASNVVYAVGEVGTVLKWDGGSWTLVSSNGVSSDLYSITGSTLGGTKFYVGGDRIALQISNGIVDSNPVDVSYSVQFLSTAVDANGVLWMSGERGLMLRNSGSNWDTMNIAPDLIDVWATSVTNAWAVGEFGFIFRYNGAQWSRQTSPTLTRLNTVWGSGPNDAFAGGDGGLILHWDGNAWTTMTSPSSGDVLSLWGTSPQNVYASTYNGEVLRYNGATWILVTSQVNPLYSVYGSGANDVYAAGDAGTVLRFNGTSWSALGTGSAALLAGIWSSSPTNVFSVGVLGTSAASYRFATSWQAVNTGVQTELTSVWGPSSVDLYVSGANGTILRYDGNAWQNMPTGSTEYLWSITGDPAGMGAGFAVGFNSTLIAGSGPASVNGLRVNGAMRTVGSLEPSREALLSRAEIARALPSGAARRSIKQSHASMLSLAGARARR